MIGFLHCWLVRLFGGKHQYRQNRKAEERDTKTCKRCGNVAPVKPRAPK